MRIDSKENGLYALIAQITTDGKFKGFWVVEYWDADANLMLERTRHAILGTACIAAVEFVNGDKFRSSVPRLEAA